MYTRRYRKRYNKSHRYKKRRARTRTRTRRRRTKRVRRRRQRGGAPTPEEVGAGIRAKQQVTQMTDDQVRDGMRLAAEKEGLNPAGLEGHDISELRPIFASILAGWHHQHQTRTAAGPGLSSDELTAKLAALPQ